jgi:hypothetical protein
MALLDRVKGILLEPRAEWPKIAAEPATTQSLYTGWIMIFAAIGPLAFTRLTFAGAHVSGRRNLDWSVRRSHPLA